jgi:hypothetical protein
MLGERPASERPRIEVVAGDGVDAVLAWYLRESDVRWTADAAAGVDAARPRVVLTRRDLARGELEALPPAPRYVIAAGADRVAVVEMR